jgi:hypothetical protein
MKFMAVRNAAILSLELVPFIFDRPISIVSKISIVYWLFLNRQDRPLER